MGPVRMNLLVTVGASIAVMGALVTTATGGATVVPALVRIRMAPGLTDAAGTAHFVSDVRLWVVTGTRHGSFVDSVGDVVFAGPDVSLVNRVTSTSTADAPVSAQIAIGRTYYIRYIDPSAPASGAWSRGTTRQPYDYLGVVGPARLATYRGPVRTLGMTTVQGRPVTEYALPIPGSMNTVPLPGGRTHHIVVRPFTEDVWLDRSGRIVRTAAVTVEADDGRTVAGRTMVTLSRFGESIHIMAPRPVIPS